MADTRNVNYRYSPGARVAMQIGAGLGVVVALITTIVLIVWGVAAFSVEGDAAGAAVNRWFVVLPLAIVFIVAIAVVSAWLFKAASEHQRLSRAARRYVGWRRNRGQT